MSKISQTHPVRLAALKDSDIDTSDIPELVDGFFNRAELRVTAKQAVTIRLDADVLHWFKQPGQGGIRPELISSCVCICKAGSSPDVSNFPY